MFSFRCDAAFSLKFQEGFVAEAPIVFVELLCLGHEVGAIIELALFLADRLEVPSE
jgi:hypothetical protein